MTRPDRWTRLLLIVAGIGTSCALFFVFLPVATMIDTAEQLGLERPSETSLFHYLTRTLSAMYALHGVVLLALSRDVPKYRPVIFVVGVATAALGAVVLGVDLHAGMPWWWTAGEGPPVIGAGILIAILCTAASRAERTASG